jgi:hypothetical protein
MTIEMPSLQLRVAMVPSGGPGMQESGTSPEQYASTEFPDIFGSFFFVL